MSTSAIAVESRRATWLATVADFVELTKPRIGLLVLVTVAASAWVTSWWQPAPVPLLAALVGTLLVSSSASALNQLFERRTDQLMDRTRNRPLPALRLTPTQVTWFAALSLMAGMVCLVTLANWQAAAWAFAAWAIYAGVYTPLKRHTQWNTAIGAISGALPVLIGAAAVEASWQMALPLFWLVVLWQFPHFMAIAWLYRRQYSAAGMKMSPSVEPSGRSAGIQAVLAALALIPVSLWPAIACPQPAATIYISLAFALGVAQLALSLAFLFHRDDLRARRLLRASLIYLPLVMLCLTVIPLW